MIGRQRKSERLPRPLSRGLYGVCTHIFPESTNIEPSTNRPYHAATIWAVIGWFGYEKLHAELDGAKIHRLENMMTMQHGIHDLFERLSIWFCNGTLVDATFIC